MRAPYSLVSIRLRFWIGIALVATAPFGSHANDDVIMAERQIELLAGAAEPETRWRAAERMGQMGIKTQSAVSALVHALGWDMDPVVRGRAAQSLGLIGVKDGQVVSALIESLDWDYSLRVRWRAVEALERIGPATVDVVPALTVVLRTDKSPGVRARAAEAVGTICPATEIVVLALTEALLSDDHPGVRWQAAAAIEKCAVKLQIAGATGAVDSLKDAHIALSAQNEPDIRTNAAAVRHAIQNLERESDRQ